MCIHYIEAEIAVDRTTDLSVQIEKALAERGGEPLRWAVVAAEDAEGPVRVEAVLVEA